MRTSLFGDNIGVWTRFVHWNVGSINARSFTCESYHIYLRVLQPLVLIASLFRPPSYIAHALLRQAFRCKKTAFPHDLTKPPLCSSGCTRYACICFLDRCWNGSLSFRGCCTLWTPPMPTSGEMPLNRFHELQSTPHLTFNILTTYPHCLSTKRTCLSY